MSSDSTHLHEVIFAARGLDPGVARVRRFHTREGLSTPYAVELEIELPAAAGDPRGLLLAPAQLAVARAQDGQVLRRYGGLVLKVVEHASRAQSRHIGVTVGPPFALLRLTRDYRIFQHKTTQQIVAQVLEDCGTPAEKVSFRLTGSYPEREVCTQYGETSFAFVSRLLEEEGIFYFFEQDEDGPTLVVADSSSAYATTAGADTLPFRSESGLLSGAAVTALLEEERVRPARVTLRDHDFKRPAVALEAVAEDAAPFGREHYEHPGRYVNDAEGRRRARVRLEAMAASELGVVGEGAAPSMAPGHTFTLTGAPDARLDREWVVRSVEHAWADTDAEAFQSRFHLLPSETPFRPPALTPPAVVPGPQVAVVTGPPGEEIHCDEFGRVKVSFPWDRRSSRDDRSSCWIRVGQMHTSGSVAIPRVGWEVIVEFEDGDPDRPVILGRLYNGKDGPPYTLPAGKSVSSLKSHSSPGGSGHNEIRMDDQSGGERMSVHAQKDQNVRVANDKTEKVGRNEVLTIGSNHALKVGGNQTEEVGADCQLDVGASQTWAVGASRTRTVSGAEAVSVEGARLLSVGGSHTQMTPLAASTSTKGAFSETVGGSCVEAAALGVGVAVAGSASVTVGGSKIEAVATGKTDVTFGARASTVGGAFISASGGDVSVGVGGAKATTVGGIFAANAGGDVALTSGNNLSLTVGGAVAINAAKIVLKVGGSSVTLAAGKVVIASREIKLTATGPQAELAPLVGDK